MPSDEQLDISPIFNGLTRPALFFGVTIECFMLVGIISLCAFILSSNLLYALVFIPLHVCGWLCCKMDQDIFSILERRSTCGFSGNKEVWGGQSYEPF